MAEHPLDACYRNIYMREKEARPSLPSPALSAATLAARLVSGPFFVLARARDRARASYIVFM